MEKRYSTLEYIFALCEQRSVFQAVLLCMLIVTLILSRLLRKQSARRVGGAMVRALKVLGVFASGSDSVAPRRRPPPHV